MKSLLTTAALLVMAMPVFAAGDMDGMTPSNGTTSAPVTTSVMDCSKAADQAACQTALDNCMKMTGTAQTACMDKMKSDMGMSNGMSHDMKNGNGVSDGVTTTVVQ